MPDGESTPEYKVVTEPYEKLVLDLLDNIKDDWSGADTKEWLLGRLKRIEIVRQARETTDAYMQARTDTFGELNE